MELLSLSFYLLQQLGIALGVGASTFAVTFYIAGTADGRLDTSEQRFLRIVHAALRFGLFLIVVTGLLITLAHILAGDSVVFAPAYLFKWALIILIIASSTLLKFDLLPPDIGGAFEGGTWYALYLLHLLAPAVGWTLLIPAYVVWLAVFGLGFVLLKKALVRKTLNEDFNDLLQSDQKPIAPPIPPKAPPVISKPEIPTPAPIQAVPKVEIPEPTPPWPPVQVPKPIPVAPIIPPPQAPFPKVEAVSTMTQPDAPTPNSLVEFSLPELPAGGTDQKNNQ